MKSLPNILTISRILVIPLCIGIMLIDNVISNTVAAWLFAYACITDFLDGALARILNAQTRFGRMLDPIADKLLVASVIIILVKDGKADLLPSIAIVCREILVSGLREFLAKLRVSLPVSSLSKFKTLLQMGAIFVLMLGNTNAGMKGWFIAGQITLWIAAALTLFTGYAYLRASYKFFSITNNKING